MTANPTNLTGEFQKRKSQDKPKSFFDLAFGEQSLANLMALLALSTDPDQIEEAGVAQQFVDFLGLKNFSEFRGWQEQARQSGQTPGQIAQSLDYRNFDFGKGGNAILNLIAKHESGGNYNVIYGGREKNLTGMTINEVLAWQRDFVRAGSPSSAAGRYQFIQSTLRGLKKELGLTGNEKFDEAMQDRLATALLERRGYSKFLRGEISEAQFMKNLSKEWASLPKDRGGASFYAGDGLNRALTSPQAVLTALHQAQQQYERGDKAPVLAQTGNDRDATLGTRFGTHASGTLPGSADPALAFAGVPDPNADRSAKPPDPPRASV